MVFAGVRSRGFTLAEAVVTMAVVALMAALAILGFRNKRPTHLFDRQVRELHADLCDARMSAIGGSCRAMVSFDGTNASYSIWVDSNSDGLRGDGETVVHRLDPALHIGLSAVPRCGSFLPTGRFGDDQQSCRIHLVSPLCGRADISIYQSGHVEMGKVEQPGGRAK